MQSLLILGRQPALGLAELESLYGPSVLQSIGEQAVVVDVDPCLLAFDRLGGSIKFCKLLTSLPSADWQEIENFLVKVSPDKSTDMPAGKMQLGLSLYGFRLSTKEVMKSGLKLKKAIQATGRSVRFIPNKQLELSSAQVIHNHLTGQNGWELVIVKAKEQTYIAQSVKVQDIANYARRDQNRPMRDARVGMLPPKLAQIIVNLAVGKLAEETIQSICDIPADQPIPMPDLKNTILDPFCGSGVIIQEAELMGYDSLASDIEPRMVEYAKSNFDWLKSNFPLRSSAKAQFKVADAASSKWDAPIDFVASETYLGPPWHSLPSSEVLEKVSLECNELIKKFLINLQPQLKAKSRLCLAVPAWQISPGKFKHLLLIDQISTLGYNLVSFKHVGPEDLIYYRADQVVARQLLVITKG